jgi:hypothetical protein
VELILKSKSPSLKQAVLKFSNFTADSKKGLAATDQRSKKNLLNTRQITQQVVLINCENYGIFLQEDHMKISKSDSVLIWARQQKPYPSCETIPLCMQTDEP